MRGAFLIGTLVSMLIMGVLTQKRLASIPKPAADLLGTSGLVTPPAEALELKKTLKQDLQKNARVTQDQSERLLHMQD